MTFTQKTILQYSILIAFGGCIGYSFAIHDNESSITTYPSNNTSSSIQKTLSNEDIFVSEKIKKAMNIIRKNSYGFNKKTTTQIEDSILKSIVNGLGDKHSTYFTKQETGEFEEMLRGDFEGIGAVINENPKGIKIMKIISGSPAEKSGLKSGDIITKVGDISLLGKTTEQAIQVIRGPKGSKAELSYKRGDDPRELYVSVVRDVVNVPSVAEKIIDKNIGYIEVSTFGDHTSTEFIKSWNRLTASGAQGMILDFRNNGGGYLDTAVDIASVVLPKNSPIVIIKQNDPNKTEKIVPKLGIKNNTTIPVIIIINEFSASASEIFAGAIKDNNRGLLLGTQSYGKGSVQEPFELGDGSIIKITTALWYTPSDISINERGVTPDINVTLTEKDYENVFDRQLEAAKIVIKDQMSSSGSLQYIKEKYSSNSFKTLTK